MKGNEFLDKMALIDPAYIEAADVTVSKRVSWLKKCGIVAACLVLLVGIGFGTYICVEDIKEYNTAVQFFNEYNLSTEGLTRQEIKNVYKDIVTKSFSDPKTAEVIIHSLSNDGIEGNEIFQEDPTPEDIEKLWNDKNMWYPTIEPNGIHYEYHSNWIDSDRYWCYVEKYDGDKLLWRTSLPDYSSGRIRGCKVVSDGVIVYGQCSIWKFSEDGRILWSQGVIDRGGTQFIRAVVENDDGSYAVFSEVYFQLCLSQISKDGERIYSNEELVSVGTIENAVCFGDGYLVQTRLREADEQGYWMQDYNKIIKVDRKGNILESFSYKTEGICYHITDMIEFGGKIYLSAYAVPTVDAQEPLAYMEIASILKYLRDNRIVIISSEEFTPIVRENYTAMLLVCDPDIGTPQAFYSVKGSLGGKFSLSDSGDLVWDVESITTAKYSPATSSHTIAGTCYVFRYTFDKTGALIGQEKTDEITEYRR